ncbi:MAG: hypothetical protein AAF645_09295 [Myxococcota bacterium]
MRYVIALVAAGALQSFVPSHANAQVDLQLTLPAQVPSVSAEERQMLRAELERTPEWRFARRIQFASIAPFGVFVGSSLGVMGALSGGPCDADCGPNRTRPILLGWAVAGTALVATALTLLIRGARERRRLLRRFRDRWPPAPPVYAF